MILGSAWPADNFWATIIKVFDVGSYAWTIILFTVIIRLVMTPVDFLQRYFTTKTSRAQAKLQPQLMKLQKQYGNNQNLLYQKQNELYQRSGFSMKGSCFVMIIYMVLTLVVFLTLFNSMQYISSYKIKNQYHTLDTVYTQSYEGDYYTYLGVNYEELNSKETAEEKEAYIKSLEDAKGNEEEVTSTKEQAISKAQLEVVHKYKEIKDSFLWIKNIWIADNATNKEILSFDSYKGLTKDNITKDRYNLVMQKLLNGEENSNGVNGYFIVAILAVAVSFLSQFLSRITTTPKGPDGKRAKMSGGSKVMMFIMPIIMLIFTVTSSAIFGIYIVTSSLVAAVTSPLLTIVINKILDKKDKAQEIKNRVDYKRY